MPHVFLNHAEPGADRQRSVIIGALSALAGITKMDQFARRTFTVLITIAVLAALPALGHSQSSVQVPAEQRALTDLLSKYNTLDEEAPNDIQREKIEQEFQREFCAKLPRGEVSGWIGDIESIDDNNPSKGVSLHLGISTGDLYSGSFGVGIWVNNYSGGSDSGTLIQVGSPLYDAVSTLREGDTVLFSGTLVPYSSEEACLKDDMATSLLIRFSSVKRIGHDIEF